MGHPKQLISYEGESLVARAARAAIESGADPVIVVLGANAAEIQAALPPLDGATVLVNAGWEDGLASSLATGLRAAARDDTCDGVLVMLADQPLVDRDILRSLIAVFQAGARLVASGYDGVPGVPAVFGREHLADLLSLKGDTGAGAWLRNRVPEVAIVPLGSAVLDVDTPADAAQLARRTGSH